MKKAIAWDVNGGAKPQRLALGHVDLEKHLEDWIEADSGIVADDTLLIGRQVATQFGTTLDLLAIDAQGDLVIIELKRDQTLRETVAQGLEYAAWASKLGFADVMLLGAQRHGGEEGFRVAFESRFGNPLPETLNAAQRILLVAPEISDSTASVIQYLSDTYRVAINAVSFDLFSVDSRTILVRHFVIEEDQAPPAPGSKRRPNRTRDEFMKLAKENGVGELFEHLLTMTDILPLSQGYVTTYAMMAKTPDKRNLAAFSIYPTADTNPGLLGVNVALENLAKLYGASPEQCSDFGKQIQEMGKVIPTWKNWVMVGLTSPAQAQQFDRAFRAFVTSAGHEPADSSSA